MLVENNYSNEDTFLILRVFLQKTKKILSLLENLNTEKSIERVISKYKPAIFWKDKPIIEKQLNKKANINYLPMQSGDMKETYADIQKSKDMLNFSPKTNLKSGLSNFVSWFKKYHNK